MAEYSSSFVIDNKTRKTRPVKTDLLVLSDQENKVNSKGSIKKHNVENLKDFSSYSLLDDFAGSLTDFITFYEAQTAKLTLRLDTNYTATANITANFTIKACGGVIGDGGSYSITVNSKIIDTMEQIFDTTANVSLGTNNDFVRPEWFGSITYGTTNTTPFIQAANDALASGEIIFNSKRIYIVEYSGSTLTIPTLAATRYCVKLSDNITLDLNGATVKLANNNYSVPFVNDGMAAGGNSNIKIINGIIDGNKSNNAVTKVTYSGEQASIIFHDVDGLHLENIKVINMQEYASRIFNVQNGYFNNLFCTDSNGSGWSFGLGSGLEVTYSYFGTIRAENCTNSYGHAGAIGNGFIFTGNNCNGQRFELKDCKQGFKIQGTSHHIQIDQIYVDGDNNQGCKLQGTDINNPIEDIQIGSVITTNCENSGFYGEFFTRCQISNIISDTDATSAAASAVWIGSGTENQIGRIYCSNAGNTGVVFRENCSYCQVGQINVKDSGQVTSGSVNLNIGGDNIQIDSVISRDTQSGAETVGNGLQIASTASNISIGKCLFEGAFTEANKAVKNDSTITWSCADVIIDGSRTYEMVNGQTTIGTKAQHFYRYYRTNNTGGTTMTSFGNGVLDQELVVLFNDNNTTIDFSGTNLVRMGNAGVDFTGGTGDYIKARYDGTNWICEVYEV